MIILLIIKLKNKTNNLYHQKPLIGIKGRLQTGDYLDKEDVKKYYTEVIAEKVTFLSSNKNKKE